METIATFFTMIVTVMAFMGGFVHQNSFSLNKNEKIIVKKVTKQNVHLQKRKCHKLNLSRLVEKPLSPDVIGPTLKYIVPVKQEDEKNSDNKQESELHQTPKIRGSPDFGLNDTS